MLCLTCLIASCWARASITKIVLKCLDHDWIQIIALFLIEKISWQISILLRPREHFRQTMQIMRWIAWNFWRSYSLYLMLVSDVMIFVDYNVWVQDVSIFKDLRNYRIVSKISGLLFSCMRILSLMTATNDCALSSSPCLELLSAALWRQSALNRSRHLSWTFTPHSVHRRPKLKSLKL